MRLHLRAPLWTLIAATALSLACTGVRVSTDFDSEVDFRRYQSFAWLDPPLREVPQPEGLAVAADPFTHNTLIDKRVRDGVEQALLARGYRRAESTDAADFHLRYAVVSREVVRDDPVYVSGGYGWGRYPYYGTGAVYGGRSYSYQEGTLILDVIDPESESIAWRGWAPSRTRDGHIDAERIAKTIDAIVAEFPPLPAEGEAFPEE